MFGKGKLTEKQIVSNLSILIEKQNNPKLGR